MKNLLKKYPFLYIFSVNKSLITVNDRCNLRGLLVNHSPPPESDHSHADRARARSVPLSIDSAPVRTEPIRRRNRRRWDR